MRQIIRLLIFLLTLIPLGLPPAWAQCNPAGTTVSLDYRTRTAGENWKMARTNAGIPDANSYTKVSTVYTSDDANSTLQVGTVNGTTLAWSADYTSAGNNTSTVIYTFSRAVSNVSVRVQDIDAVSNAAGLLTPSNGFTDEVTFTGANGGTAVVPSLARANAVTTYTNLTANTATGKTSGGDNMSTDNATVIATYPTAVTSITIRYRNTTAATTLNNQAVGIDLISWCRITPTTVAQSNTATLPTSAGQVGIDNLNSTVDGTVKNFTITAIPPTSQGVLYYNSSATTTPSYVAITAANQTLTAAQAAGLRFDPAAGATGTGTTFSFDVTDDANLVSNISVYTIPLQVVTACAATSTLDFSTLTTGESWKAHAAVSVPAGSPRTQVSTSGYTVDAASSANSTFAIGVQTTGNTIQWQNTYANGSAKTSSVTFNFTRAVSNFTVRVEDIDAGNNYLDQVVFTGKNGATPVTPTLSPVTANQTFFVINGNTATGVAGQANNTRDGATVVAYFPADITSLTLTYNNAAAGTTSAAQAVGVDLMNWCALAPVAYDVTSTVSNAAGQTPVYSLSSVVDGTATYQFTSLPTAAQGVLYVNGVAATTTQVLTALQATQLTFAPVATFSGALSFGYVVIDNASPTNQQASATYTINSTASGASGTPAACANPGRDGSPTGLTTNPNTYYPSTAAQTLAVGATSIAVGAATGTGNIAAGDLLLVIQMQGADIDATNTDTYGDGVAGSGANGNLSNINFKAGTYEYVVANSAVTATAGGTIQLATALKNSYVNAAATATTGQRRFQVVRVPQFGNLTLGGNITPTRWNGSVGGIIAIDVAKQTNLNGFTIDVSGAGFRGGAGRQLVGNGAATGTDYRFLSGTAGNTSGAHGSKGEGTAGTPAFVNSGATGFTNGTGTLLATGSDYPNGSNGRGAPGNAGGGGTDNLGGGNNSENSGGGGGANGGSGGRGGNTWNTNFAIGGEPGAAFAVASSSQLVLGGGGGAGSTNDATGTPANGFASSGAAGGGIVLLRTGTVSGTGTILANGLNANNSVANDGSGGGGAGGSILVTATTPAGLANITVTANGGTGGTNTGSGDTHGPGGGGGGGVILTNGATAAASAASGAASGTTAGGTAFGAAAGSTGAANAQISSSIANSESGANCPADVTTTLAGPAILNAGQPSGTFTATFSNDGPNMASGVTQTVTIPAGATNVLVNGAAYTPTSNVIDFGNGTTTTLVSGATNTFTYSFTAPTTTGTVTQTSNVGAGSGQGANTAADAATLTSTVNPVADVATTITPSAASVAAGQPASFAVTFTNNGPSAAAAVTPTVQLAAGLTGVTVSYSGAGTATYNSTTGVVTYPSATFNSGTTNTSTISFKMPANGSVTGTSTINTTTNEAGLTANDVAATTISGTPVFDLTTKISGPATTVAGTLTTYGVLTINSGPSAATTASQLVQLPTNLTNVFVSNGGTYDASSGVVTFPTLAGLISGGVVNNTISFMAPSAAFPVSATVSGDVNTANNTAYLNGNASSTNVTVTPASTTNANLYTTIMTPGADDVQPGTAVTFTVVAGNNGPSAATGVVERVELPSGLSGVTVSGGGTYDATTGLVTLPTVTSLVSGTANTYTITVNAPVSGMMTATASISATTNDLMLADNVATTDVTVNGVPDVATTISGPAKANAGQTVTYTVTTTNNGLAPAANVVQTVNIPAGLTSVTISGSGTYDPNTGIVTFPAIAGQVSGNSVQNTITYSAPAIGASTVIASVTAASPDNVKTNNRATITTTTDAISDVTVSLSGPTTIVQGNQIDYLVVTTNNGPSSATNVATRVQLPAGLGANNVTLTTGVGAMYDNATGVVTFTPLGTQRPGQPGTVTNVIRFIAPAGLSQINATASVSTSSEESNYANNTSSIITTETAPTTTQTDLSTTVSSTPATLTAGQPASLSVTTKNGGPGTATGVVQRVALEAGLTISSITNGGTYDPNTGIVTFPAISLTSGTTTTNTITLVAPGTNPLQVRALVTGNESDPASGNNTDFKSLTINPVVDVATSVSGPTAVATGDAVTYSVLTLNNGPSTATNVIQTVTIPTGLTGVVVSNGGTYDASSGIVTFATIATQNGDASSQVMNTISFTAPSTSFMVVGNVTTSSTEPNTTAATANNMSPVTAGPINTAPVANAVVNSLQTPEGNTAGPLLLSPLSATDAAPGTVASYRIATIPAASQGVLSLNGTAVKVGDVIPVADASKLRFDPVATFVGNAFFTYTATDNQGAGSAVAATYTIPVGQDNASMFVNTPVKSNGNAYQNNDVISNAFDVNGGAYDSGAAVTDNGIRNATTDAAGTTQLAGLGISLNAATGQLTVTDRTKLKQGTYSVNITTTDVDGGVTTQTVTYTIGANPLPVTLTAFTAQAVQNRDALLNWATASEQNSASFEVERSLDGNTFTKVGQVAAQGTSASTTAYTFTDAGIGARTQGSVYYRLHQLDLNGTAAYSPVRTVSFTKVATVALSIYPNPATTSTSLDLSALPASATYQVVVLDATGRQVLATFQAGGLPQPLDLTNLASGTYQVLVTGKLGDGSALRQALRLIKE